MRGLEMALDWLRPFVENHGWDCCVVWRLGDDPSRFVEFMDCCCAGGSVSGSLKEEKCRNQIGVQPVCRDVHQMHPIRSKACETLAQIPAAMPLYSGIHTEVALSNEPQWLSGDDGTLVLIPLGGGLIELFSSTHVDKDQSMLDFIKYQYKASLELDAQQNNPNPSFHEVSQQSESELGLCLQNSSPGVLFTDSTSKVQLQPLIRVTIPQNRASFPGSSTGSNPNNPLSQDGSLPPSSSNTPCSKESVYLGIQNHVKPEAGAASFQATAVSGKRNVKYPKLAQKAGKEGPSKAKNLQIERNRRSRIKDGEFQLRALVPNITKMDRASIIGDAITYITELKKTVQELELELKSDDDFGENVVQGVKFSGKENTRIKSKYSQVQVEVSEIHERSFQLRIVVGQQEGGFLRLMEAVSFAGLQVEEFNITSCDGQVVYSFRVEAGGNAQADQLREALIKKLGTTKL